MPILPDTRREAEIRYRILTTIQANMDKCPTTTIREGALHGNDSAFYRILGEHGVFTRNGIVNTAIENGVTYYGRTATGIGLQEKLKWFIELDDHGRQVWRK